MAANRGSNNCLCLRPTAWFFFVSGWFTVAAKQKNKKQTSWVWGFFLWYLLRVGPNSCVWIAPVLLSLASAFSCCTQRAFNCSLSLVFLWEDWGRVVPRHAVDGLSLSWRSPGLGPLRSSFACMGLRSLWTQGWVLHTFPYSLFLLVNSFPYLVQIWTFS